MMRLKVQIVFLCISLLEAFEIYRMTSDISDINTWMDKLAMTINQASLIVLFSFKYYELRLAANLLASSALNGGNQHVIVAVTPSLHGLDVCGELRTLICANVSHACDSDFNSVCVTVKPDLIIENPVESDVFDFLLDYLERSILLVNVGSSFLSDPTALMVSEQRVDILIPHEVSVCKISKSFQPSAMLFQNSSIASKLLKNLGPDNTSQTDRWETFTNVTKNMNISWGFFRDNAVIQGQANFNLDYQSLRDSTVLLLSPHQSHTSLIMPTVREDFLKEHNVWLLSISDYESNRHRLKSKFKRNDQLALASSICEILEENHFLQGTTKVVQMNKMWSTINTTLEHVNNSIQIHIKSETDETLDENRDVSVFVNIAIGTQGFIVLTGITQLEFLGVPTSENALQKFKISIDISMSHLFSTFLQNATVFYIELTQNSKIFSKLTICRADNTFSQSKKLGMLDKIEVSDWDRIPDPEDLLLTEVKARAEGFYVPYEEILNEEFESQLSAKKLHKKHGQVEKISFKVKMNQWFQNGKGAVSDFLWRFFGGRGKAFIFFVGLATVVVFGQDLFWSLSI